MYHCSLNIVQQQPAQSNFVPTVGGEGGNFTSAPSCDRSLAPRQGPLLKLCFGKSFFSRVCAAVQNSIRLT